MFCAVGELGRTEVEAILPYLNNYKLNFWTEMRFEKKNRSKKFLAMETID